MAARHVVGIDLGTTHTLVAYASVSGGEPPRIFEVPQLVSASEVEARALYPSCLYAPVAGEAPPDPFGDAPFVTGEQARRRGAEVPGRLVASSKSWLSYGGVDRTASILPWGAADDDAGLPKLSPLEAAERLLRHVARAWDAAFADAPLADQDVVLCVPASFDEVARELTVEAARRAGVVKVRLLEEPQAAFYDCMRRTPALEPGLVLVVDVGGGTTDLSLIRVDAAGAVTRVATGHHLLLGGDNMDLALAHVCEERFGAEKLDPARFAQLTVACRAAKERLLAEDAPEQAKVTVLGHGAKLLGGALTTSLTRDEVEELVLDAFFAPATLTDRPQRAKSALVAFGLPFERDVAVTRHVAWFVARHVASDDPPTALLLNGGVFRARRIVERLREVVQSWRGAGDRVEVLPHTDPDLAVALGAVAFGLALRGYGRRIRGGAAHGYYVALEGGRAVCVVPRGAEEETKHVATSAPLKLLVGRPARFDLWASEGARVDAPGALVTLDDEGFRPLPPVAAAFDPGAAGEVDVVVEGLLTSVGTLELACVEKAPPPGASPRRFRLAFQLRGAGPSLTTPPAAPFRTNAPPPVSGRPSPSSPPASASLLASASNAIDRVFGKPRPEAAVREVKDLVRELERLLGERSAWSKDTTRALFDALAPLARSRRRSPDHERVFWLLAGYCLRPGVGDPLDASRVAALVPLFGERLAFPDSERGWQQYFIAVRRVAAGLDDAAQVAIRDFVDPFLAPNEAGLKKPKKARVLALDDALDAVSSLERAPAARRAELGGWVLERTWTDRDPRLWAAVGRLGARVPTYASAHHVVAPHVAERWLDHLMREKWTEVPTAAQAAVQLARVTDDRARDVPERVRREVEKRLVAMGAKVEWVRAVRERVDVDEGERAAFFGEGLPPGLRLGDGDGDVTEA